MKIKPLFIFLLIFSSLVILQFLDFLALHDIKRDYLGPVALSRLSPEIIVPPEDWMSCALEWRLVEFSFYFRLFLLVLTLAASLFLIFKRRD